MQPPKNLGSKILDSIVGESSRRKISKVVNYFGKKITLLFPKDIQNNKSVGETSKKGQEIFSSDKPYGSPGESPNFTASVRKRESKKEDLLDAEQAVNPSGEDKRTRVEIEIDKFLAYIEQQKEENIKQQRK